MTMTLTQRVAYSRGFLQSTGQFCGRAPFIRGTITETHKNLPLVTVTWDDGQSQLINAANLVAEDRLHLEPA